MRKVILTISYIFCLLLVKAQAPPGLPFSGQIIDANNNVAKSQTFFIRTRLTTTIAPIDTLEEVFTVTTNNDGLFSLVIGQGLKTSGNVTSIYGINWVHGGSIKLHTEYALKNGIVNWFDPALNYIDNGETVLQSVPFALSSLYSISTVTPPNIPKSDLVTKGILQINNDSIAKNIVMSDKPVVISIIPGNPNSTLTTDDKGNVVWSTKKVVNGYLLSFTLQATTQGSNSIAENSFALCYVPVPGVKPGDPVFAFSTEDNEGFIPYNSFVSTSNIVTIRFANFQATPFSITGKRFSLLIIQ